MLQIIDRCIGNTYNLINIREQDTPNYNVACVLVDSDSPWPYIKGAHSRNTPVIWIASSMSKDKIQMGLEMGLNNYIVKPFRPEQLLDKVGAAIVNHH